jgi:hypothetical protein
MAYLFLVIAINYWYVFDAPVLWFALLQSIGTSLIVTMIGLMLLYYLT